jgi:hypothetical protein
MLSRSALQAALPVPFTHSHTEPHTLLADDLADEHLVVSSHVRR